LNVSCSRILKLLTHVASADLNFAESLYSTIQEYVVAWACGPSSFVILAMLEHEEQLSSESKKHLRRDLKKQKKVLESAATVDVSTKGAGKKDGGKPQNVGTSLILKLL
jgi:hypothetical protein